MTLPPFELHGPHSVEEATDLLERYGDDAAVYCGGTELLLLMKLGFAEYRHLVDVKGIDELRTLRADDGHLNVGAAVTHRQIDRSPLVRLRWPAFAEMERVVANVRVRNVGTLGGNLCFADPHSDPATFLLAADAELLCRRGAEQARRVPATEFFRGPYQTALRGCELLVAIHLPELPPGSAMVHRKFAFHERPVATVTCLARVESDRVVEARVAVGSVGLVPVRGREAEDLLVGAPAAGLDGERLAEAGDAAARAAVPVDDSNGSVEYKQNLVRVLVARCLKEAVARAGGLAQA